MKEHVLSFKMNPHPIAAVIILEFEIFLSLYYFLFEHA